MMTEIMVSAISGGTDVMAFIKPLPDCRMPKKNEASKTPIGVEAPSKETAIPSNPCEGMTPICIQSE